MEWVADNIHVLLTIVGSLIVFIWTTLGVGNWCKKHTKYTKSLLDDKILRIAQSIVTDVYYEVIHDKKGDDKLPIDIIKKAKELAILKLGEALKAEKLNIPIELGWIIEEAIINCKRQKKNLVEIIEGSKIG